MNRIAATALTLALLAAPGLASAAPAWTSSQASLRSGPDRDYPRVDNLRAGQRVEVHGCLRDWSWCDVSSGRQRGWVAASALQREHAGRRAPISVQRSGLAVLDFFLGDYWDRHYRAINWYAKRVAMERAHPQHVRRPAPVPHVAPPPPRPVVAGPGPGKPTPGGHGPGIRPQGPRGTAF